MATNHITVKFSLISPDLDIDNQLTAEDIKFIKLFRECDPKEQKYFISEISLSARASRRARQNDLAREHKNELEAAP